MRITNNMLSRKYVGNLNSSLEELDRLNDQVASGRKYAKASDDPATALKALQVRRNLARISQYQTNLTDAANWLMQTESTVAGIKEIATQAYEATLQGMTGTVSETDRKILGQQLRDLQEQLLQMANSNFSGRYILGGANTRMAPFTVDGAGKLLYNGQDVDGAAVNNVDVFYDLGMGLQLDAAGEIKPETAFTISTNGALVLGSGIDGNGLPNNLYRLIGQISQCFEGNDLSNMDTLLAKLINKNDDIMASTVEVGEKSSFVEFLQNRFDTDEINALAKQSDLEEIDSARVIIDFKSQEAAYQAALAMGAKIIQPSLMDFLR